MITVELSFNSRGRQHGGAKLERSMKLTSSLKSFVSTRIKKSNGKYLILVLQLSLSQLMAIGSVQHRVPF